MYYVNPTMNEVLILTFVTFVNFLMRDHDMNIDEYSIGNIISNYSYIASMRTLSSISHVALRIEGRKKINIITPT